MTQAIQVKPSGSRSCEKASAPLCNKFCSRRQLHSPWSSPADARWRASSHRILVRPAGAHSQYLQSVRILRCLCSHWRCEALCLTLPPSHIYGHMSAPCVAAAVAVRVRDMRDELILVLCVEQKPCLPEHPDAREEGAETVCYWTKCSGVCVCSKSLSCHELVWFLFWVSPVEDANFSL